MRMRKIMRKIYANLVIASMKDNPISIPEKIQRHYINIVGYECTQAIREFIGNKNKVLLVGDGAGRDYYFLKMLAKDTVAMDIAKQPILDRLIIANAEEIFPFKDQTFDAVIIMDVIEHLFKDFSALENIRRVLKDNGLLILSVPFHHDFTEVHVRVHTPNTIRRLLEFSGFSISKLICRGGIMTFQRFPVYNYFVHGFNLFCYILFKKTFYNKMNSVIWKIDRYLGIYLPNLFKLSPWYGAFILAIKVPKKDFIKLNIDMFKDMREKSAINGLAIK